MLHGTKYNKKIESKIRETEDVTREESTSHIKKKIDW